MQTTALIVATTLLAWMLGPTDTPSYFHDPRDGNQYHFVAIDGLHWFTENLRYKTDHSISVSTGDLGDNNICGEFYSVNEAFKACPQGWRLPTEKEVKSLIKKDKKGQIKIIDTLQVTLCGRIDNGKLSKSGLQNTFWIDAELKDGYITHWHTFAAEQELHRHNVTNAKRQFPVRCVCEIQP